MSSLTFLERRKLEELLGMGSGYVLDFSNRTFTEMILESTGKHIYSECYDNASGSKANRLRAFWKVEPDAVVGKLMGDMLEYCDKTKPLVQDCKLIVARLLGKTPAGCQSPATSHTTGPAPKVGPSDARI